MGLGLSFGANKSNNKGISTVDKIESIDQSGSSNTSTQGTTTTTGNTTQTGSTTGQQNTSQSGTTSQTGQVAGSSTQTGQLFSGGVLSDLEGAVHGLFGGGAARVDANGLPAFNANEFVSNGMAKAANSVNSSLNDSINQLIHTTGGTPASNSAVALLANRARGDAEANLAGVDAQLTNSAQEIARNNLLAQAQVQGGNDSFLASLVNSLKGGVSTTQGTEAQSSSQSGATSQSGQTNSSEQNSQNQTTQSTQTQQLVQLLTQLLSGSTHTVGTETTDETSKKAGGGLSLSL